MCRQYYLVLLHMIDLQSYTDYAGWIFNQFRTSPDIKCPYEAPDVCAAGANTIVGNIMSESGWVWFIAVMILFMYRK